MTISSVRNSELSKAVLDKNEILLSMSKKLSKRNCSCIHPKLPNIIITDSKRSEKILGKDFIELCRGKDD